MVVVAVALVTGLLTFPAAIGGEFLGVCGVTFASAVAPFALVTSRRGGFVVAAVCAVFGVLASIPAILAHDPDAGDLSALVALGFATSALFYIRSRRPASTALVGVVLVVLFAPVACALSPAIDALAGGRHPWGSDEESAVAILWAPVWVPCILLQTVAAVRYPVVDPASA